MSCGNCNRCAHGPLSVTGRTSAAHNCSSLLYLLDSCPGSLNTELGQGSASAGQHAEFLLPHHDIGGCLGKLDVQSIYMVYSH